MGEKTSPLSTGSFLEGRFAREAALKGTADRGKPRPGRKETTARKAPKSPSGDKPRGTSSNTKRKQTPAQRAASLRNLARARAAQES